MCFTGENLPLPHRPFPFDSSACALPTQVPDCHLVRTVIPCLPNYDSLGDFHDRMCYSLSLFCKHGFQERYRQSCGHHNYPRGPLSPHVHSRQATLHAATRFCALLCRFLPDSYAKRLPKGVPQLRRTRFRSPRKPGRMRHAIGARPESLTPSIHPKLGVKSRHQGLHRYALQRIFRPFLENGHSD